MPTTACIHNNCSPINQPINPFSVIDHLTDQFVWLNHCMVADVMLVRLSQSSCAVVYAMVIAVQVLGTSI